MTAPGELVKKHRRRSGLTQRALADLAGLSLAALRDLEQGRVVAPRAGALRRLADALALSPTEAAELSRLIEQANGSRTGLRIEVLGPLQVTVDGMEVDPGSETQRILLGLLALSPNTPLHRDALVELAWGSHATATTVDLLQSRISRLRRRLRSRRAAESERVVTAVQGGYQLTAIENTLDLLKFRNLCQKASEARASRELATACDIYQEAVRLWRGKPLEGLTSLETYPTVVALTRERHGAVLAYSSVAAQVGRHDEVIPLLNEIVAEEPLHEQAYARLMIALTGSGQQAAALELYDDVRRRLVEELGADPGAELVEAHRRVLCQQVVQPATTSVSAHRQLPPDIADFSGRTAELAALSDQIPRTGDLGTAVVISSIIGMGGVGKTRLAVHLAHQLVAAGRYSDEQLYVDLHGHTEQPPADPAAVLASFLHLLGIPGDQIPDDLGARAALYRDRLHKKDALVVLDNAASEDQIEPLLPSSSSNLVLITSRRALAVDGTYTLPLDVFTPTEAHDFLVRVVGERRVNADPDAVSEVLELCGRLPLAVALVARRMQSRHAWTFGDLAKRLRNAKHRLYELAAGHRRLREMFDLSYQTLSAEQQRLFRLLGMIPGEDFTAEAVASLAERTPEAAGRILEQLANEHLVTAVTGDRYSMQELVRDYARHAMTTHDTIETRTEAFTRLLDYYLHTADRANRLLQSGRETIALTGSAPLYGPELVSKRDAKGWLEAERACIASAIWAAAEGRWATYAWQLTYSLREYLYLYGYTEDWQRTHEKTLEAVLAANDMEGEGITRTYLAATYMNEGRAYEARTHLYRALELHRQTGNRAEEITTLGSLGILCYRLGQFTEALQHFERATSLCAGQDPYREGILVTNCGIVLTALGQIDEALSRYRHGLELARQAGNPDGESCVLADLGDAHRRLRHYEESLAHLEEALAVVHNNDLVPKEAYVRHRLGNTYRDLGNLSLARENLERALRIVRSLSSSHGTESEILINLAAVHRDADDLEVSRSLLNEGHRAAQQRGELYQQARALDGLARVHEKSGRSDDAQRLWNEAFEIFTRLGTPEIEQVRDNLLRCGVNA